MTNLKKWFVIINPTSGNGSGLKKWPKIQHLLKVNDFNFEYMFTQYSNHSIDIVKNAISKGFRNIISVGGDGTLHNIVNGVMKQKNVPTATISIGVIPVGTGNDWIKTHQIPKDINKAITLIKNQNTKLQDIGKIEFIHQAKSTVYFVNLAGIGFDGYVVSRVEKYKQFGALSYFMGVLFALMSFKNFRSKVHLNSEFLSENTLMILIGLCKYSGGGMQLTQTPNPFDGLFDISIAKNFSKLDVIKNIAKLFNGNIINYKKVASRKTEVITIDIESVELPFIQADGEIIGRGNLKASIIPKVFSFYCK
jgi:YegS/Rv2252/BmrU family lipid kinase